ncbi:peptidylprolyl isomerase [Babesia microti strain RI]|uniref:Serine/threonine-protein phosphatase 2A activator n=1 Tax=Babesia microti (strain RI) TaxID=1133968 RepID=A0A1R4ABA0_BABMR|nr:peptidylprolyl isomerase [Babesia microti strain RI]SJK86293.1 peptidylprolyl isomerase [Babesia microti strain RI]|eukprot:XP_021338469.1 peptidylprolyl isomerase [Babesia microti strain RI]
MSEIKWPVPQEQESLPQLDKEFVESTQNFISELSSSIVGYQTPTMDYCHDSNGIIALLNLLENVRSMTIQFEPIRDTLQRFGNKAFKHLINHLEQNVEALLAPIIKLSDNISESTLREDLRRYLIKCFGNKTRLDYGTGHELSFACLVKTLYQHGILGGDDRRDVVLFVFQRYFKLVRHLIELYNLEPAGSKGVWGLDDYQFLPFIFGAAQLQIQSSITPEQAIERPIIEMYKDAYIYIEALGYITACKRSVPFYECSPMLYDISGIKSWKKIYVGLLNMYRDHVLSRNIVINEINSGKD